jgi:acyl-CoA synthetase (AMP-forming)/AMP-acid ligase II
MLWSGRLYIVGRIKDVLTVRGRTLHASDVEVCAEAACAEMSAR